MVHRMQRAILPFLFFLFLFPGVKGQFTKAGGGLVLSPKTVYHSEPSGSLGLNLTGILELNLPFHLSPGFTYILPWVNKYEIFDSSVRISNSRAMIDLDAHYVFNSLDRIEFYALGGINVSTYRYVYREEFLGEVIKNAHRDIYPGLNLGAGGYFRLNDQLDIMAEGKVVLAKALQFQVIAGVLVNLRWFAQHDE